MCMVFVVDECMVNIFETYDIIVQRKIMYLNLKAGEILLEHV